MSNRKKIKRALNEAGFKIKHLEFIRSRESIYGDSFDASYWYAETECGETFASDKGDTVNEGVDIMISEIQQTSKQTPADHSKPT